MRAPGSAGLRLLHYFPGQHGHVTTRSAMKPGTSQRAQAGKDCKESSLPSGLLWLQREVRTARPRCAPCEHGPGSEGLILPAAPQSISTSPGHPLVLLRAASEGGRESLQLWNPPNLCYNSF